MRIFILISAVIFLFNSPVFAQEDEDKKNLFDIINARLQYRAVSDKIPVYSHNQCVIGNCSPYAIPELEKLPEETQSKKKVITKKPKQISDVVTEFVKKSCVKEQDYKNFDTSVTVLKINDTIAYDFEVVIWPDKTISVPVKTLADLIEIPITINHVNNNITFKQPLTDEEVVIDTQKSTVLVGTNLVQVNNPKIVTLNEGFIVQNEVFIPEKLAQYLFDVDTSFLKENYILDLKTTKVLKAIIKLEEQEDDVVEAYEDPVDFVDKTVKENKTFNIKQLNYGIGSSASQSSSSNQSVTSQNMNANISSKGYFLGGEYNVGTNANYSQNGMEIGGYTASLSYLKGHKELSIGSINAGLSDLAAPSASIVGVKYGTLGASSNSAVLPRFITGQADNNTHVELFINDMFTDKQAVEGGRYEFDSINYPHSSFVKIRVEQIGTDNTRKIIYEDELSQDSDLLAPGQKEYLVFSGVDNSITRHKFKLFGDTIETPDTTPLKAIIGAKYRRGITPRLTAGTNIAHNYNLTPGIFTPNTTISDYPRAYRQSTFVSGSVASVDMDYAVSENLKISSELGLSNASSISDYEPNAADMGSFVSFNYEKPKYNLSGKVFSYGPDFYTGSYSDAIDKKGFELNGSWNVDNVNFSGNVVTYNSNLDNLFGGGISTITDYNFAISGPINEYANMRAGVRSSIASNSLYSNNQTNFDLNLNTRLSDKASLMMGYTKTINQNDTYSQNLENKMMNNRFNTELMVDLDKAGKLRLAHEVTVLTPYQQLFMSGVNTNRYEPPIFKNFNLKLDRSSQPIKGFTLSPNMGYRYGGSNNGLLFGMQVGYEFRPGRQIVLNYSYNSIFSNFLNGMNFGGNSSHSLSMNFVDTLNLGMGNNPMNHSPFPYNPENGIIKGYVFLDLNQNGVKELEEEGIPDIDVTVKDMYTVTTDNNGYFMAANLSDRIHRVEINKTTLPVIYSPTSNDVAVRVKKSKIYVANLGLIITPGSISGNVEVNRNDASNKDVIILLLNKDGKEIKYTTTDSTGHYYMDSVPPGDYKVVVDNNYLAYNGLQTSGEEAQLINMPLILDDFVDIEDINFSLIPKQAEVQSF